MNFYVDFEATQPEQEIISIGAYSDDEESFYSLIRPQFSSISPYIRDMTGITQEMLEMANSYGVVMTDFYFWCQSQEPDVTKWHFYSYGDGDIDFLKHTLPNANTETSLIITSLMIATMKDYSKSVTKFFCGSTSLIKAFNYLESLENKQKHNALEDAKMLADVFCKVESGTPLTTYPFATIPQEVNYTFPSGRFFCKAKGKNAKEREFGCIQEAIEWIINTNIAKNSRETVRRDKMATKIMKAIRKNECYMNYKWRRDKNTKILFFETEQTVQFNGNTFWGKEVEHNRWVVWDGTTQKYAYIILEENKIITINNNKVNINGTNYEIKRKIDI